MGEHERGRRHSDSDFGGVAPGGHTGAPGKSTLSGLIQRKPHSGGHKEKAKAPQGTVVQSNKEGGKLKLYIRVDGASVTTGQRGHVLASNGKPYPGGEFIITSVPDPGRAVAETHLSYVNANSPVTFEGADEGPRTADGQLITGGISDTNERD